MTTRPPLQGPPGADNDAGDLPGISVPGYSGPERRSEFRLWRESIDAALQAVDQRLDDGSRKMTELQVDMSINTEATNAVQRDTAELVELLHSVKGAFRVLDMLARMAKPLGVLAMACAGFVGLWAALKGGGGGLKG